ncbi:MAG TPA: aldehyde dehydrogenase family protein [Arthrobacter sp.]|nr:aldehyde dehydrogenase family protein [Arthrobacter sp.]
MATRKLAPALAAGCTAVLKPATLTPLTALAIAQLMVDAGTPAGVVNVITTSTTSEVMSPLLADPRVRKLSFTGSTSAGRHLLRQAAGNVLKCSMELGGNAPFLVFDDADLEKTLDGAMIAKMRNGGQVCTAANRISVQRGIHDDFARRLAGRRMGTMRAGPAPSPTSRSVPSWLKPRPQGRAGGVRNPLRHRRGRWTPFSCQPTWMRGLRAGSCSCSRRISRTTGAVSPRPSSR